MSVPMRKIRVLVIEDEASVLAFMRAALERGGYTVVGARSGVLGLEMLAAADFAGVISDMRTPAASAARKSIAGSASSGRNWPAA